MLGLAALLLLAAASGLVLACGGDDEGSGDEAQTPKTLRLASAYEFATSWDVRVSGFAESAYLRNMYDGLLIAAPPGSAEEFIPQLAESWEVSEDGMTWTFNLRQGVKFSDGEAFNADAVKFSFESTMERGGGASYILGDIESIDVVDEYTVAFKIAYPFPLDKVLSACDATYIFSPASAGLETEDWTGKSFGTGPYMIESHKLGDEYVFVRNPNWWGEWQDGNPETVVLKIVGELSTQRQMLEAGEVDFIYQVDRDAAAAMQGNPDLQVFSVASTYQYQLVLNTLAPPLDDKTFRQALAWGTPYDDIQAACGGDALAPRAIGYVPQAMYGASADLPQYSYDPAKAADLLAQAGYPDGEGARKLTLYYLTDVALHDKYTPLVKEAYEELGLEIEMKPILASAWEPLVQGPMDQRHDILSERAYPSYAHAYDMLNYQFHSFDEVEYNASYWSSPATDRLLDEAWQVEATDSARAQEMYNEIQRIVLEECPIIPLFDPADVWAASATVTIVPDALNGIYRGPFWTGITL
ncbi:MAG: ABC transporter substrate-binding protein [Thermoleophilia bacterium]|nr:ABC transporter substrate-binding protein [Thermoleophilia bacterium]